MRRVVRGREVAREVGMREAHLRRVARRREGGMGRAVPVEVPFVAVCAVAHVGSDAVRVVNTVSTRVVNMNSDKSRVFIFMNSTHHEYS